tara:strand:+ start:1202 stop:1408 length:207 start_codon:yes stop_codon:yes gene_type:complete
LLLIYKDYLLYFIIEIMKASVSKATRAFKDIIDMLNEMIDNLKNENKQLKKENIRMKEKINKLNEILS